MACNLGFGACAIILPQSAAQRRHSSGVNIAGPQKPVDPRTTTCGSGGEALSARYSSPHTRLLPELNIPSVRYLTQQNSIFDLCCADDTLFGVMLLSESWDCLGRRGDALRVFREAADPPLNVKPRSWFPSRTPDRIVSRTERGYLVERCRTQTLGLRSAPAWC